jgi:hypothetical protein
MHALVLILLIILQIILVSYNYFCINLSTNYKSPYFSCSMGIIDLYLIFSNYKELIYKLNGPS